MQVSKLDVSTSLWSLVLDISTLVDDCTLLYYISINWMFLHRGNVILDVNLDICTITGRLHMQTAK